MTLLRAEGINLTNSNAPSNVPRRFSVETSWAVHFMVLSDKKRLQSGSQLSLKLPPVPASLEGVLTAADLPPLPSWHSLEQAASVPWIHEAKARLYCALGLNCHLAFADLQASRFCDLPSLKYVHHHIILCFTLAVLFSQNPESIAECQSLEMSSQC